jgi:hypothetical protein
MQWEGILSPFYVVMGHGLISVEGEKEPNLPV